MLAQVVPKSGGKLAEADADPVSPDAGDTWVLRTLQNPAGTLQALVGGVPMVTVRDASRFDLSFFTAEGDTVRVQLT